MRDLLRGILLLAAASIVVVVDGYPMMMEIAEESERVS
jgi:hypothetical protein